MLVRYVCQILSEFNQSLVARFQHLSVLGLLLLKLSLKSVLFMLHLFFHGFKGPLEL
jgi:hypothetical protein